MTTDVLRDINASRFDSFQRSYVDLRSPEFLDRTVEVLNEFGFATFDGLSSPEDLLPIAAQFGNVIIHRDSDARGITTIAPKEGAESVSGLAGFTNKELFLHTDGTAMDNPASFLLIYCNQPAESGGESMLLDGKKLYEELAKTNPVLLEELKLPGSAVFGSAQNQHKGSILEIADGLKTLRFRYDELGIYSPTVTQNIPELLAIMDGLQVKFSVKKGQGYIVNNRRSLHGRTPFVGNREMFRVLVNVDTATPIGEKVELGFK